MLARYGSAAGRAVAPTMRICWAKVPCGRSTITETIGSWIYWLSTTRMSSASWAGVLPTATMSVISGVVMRPSGRTPMRVDSSGLRQTKMLSSSDGPI